MTLNQRPRRSVTFALVAILALSVYATYAQPTGRHRHHAFRERKLISDLPGVAEHRDSLLVNPWGIGFGPAGKLWIADNGTGVATLYRPNGISTGLVVTIPPPLGSSSGAIAAPTGLVFNDSSGDFMIGGPTLSAPARILFATEDGTISGWNPDVDPTHALLAVDNSASGAVYKGIALGENSAGNFIFATDFHNAKIDVFDPNFAPATLTGTFTDPNLPAGFAPFGIRTFGTVVAVTYALQKGPENHDDQAGPGNGFVDFYDTDGLLISRFASQGPLNSPWGLALAPDNFGDLGGALLVGNFGDGTINAFDPNTGQFLMTVPSIHGGPIVIDGLWGLDFPGEDNIGGGGSDEIYFSSGLNDEADGLVGLLAPVPRKAGHGQQNGQ